MASTLHAKMTGFNLRFPLEEIPRWAAAYTYPLGDTEPIAIGLNAKATGFLTRPEFLALARWKSARPSKHHEKNDEATVEEVTRFAFGTPVELLRLRSLTLLAGVQPRTASAILHLCHRDPYPMMDVRAFWSLGIDIEPTDWVGVWPEYVQACRSIASKARTDMRTLDRALWGFSAHNGRLATRGKPKGHKVLRNPE